MIAIKSVIIVRDPSSLALARTVPAHLAQGYGLVLDIVRTLEFLHLDVMSAQSVSDLPRSLTRSGGM
ncbi:MULTISPECIES: hypothetical protein [Mesorhizobium]|uniref:hypothetical protein n=1 Tax=Mesorhizobium TaxID=68287 RepID=UPI0007EC9119|nr:MULTISPECIES: hypothetical protein [Mesorhizobium]TPJ43711.1 hypothetical protein FJ437_20315 [Mesorhizobium sp. B2-6-6]ARP67338.1 hypothetical protein A9K65_031505 [Mesorhizobium sp. WSM1497]MCA0002933.1 hypothetical protein [Mesorhizobium sp. B264B2A]MCA0009219.1 hypothetical protein [Mesorhizobium sp. B264B1B]MCA0013980.1 hypothetical protein [Mesorhizobium sp. B294B1A1]